MTDTEPASDGVADAFAANLRRLRSGRGWSLRDFSAATGISPAHLSRLETGLRQPSLDVLVTLRRALEVDVDALLAANSTHMLLRRKAELVWEVDQAGTLKFISSGQEQTIGFDERLSESGRSPEELVAAAQAVCAAMTLLTLLRREGHEPAWISATTEVELEYFGNDSGRLAAATVTLQANVPDITQDRFAQLAKAVTRHSPISKALSGLEINVSATLA